MLMVGDTEIEPVASSVSRKRSPTELIARSAQLPRWRRDLNPCTRLCRPLPRLSATPPRGPSDLRADDGIRTRDPHLGKVMLYQLSHVRTTRTARSRGVECLRTLADRARASPTDYRPASGAADQRRSGDRTGWRYRARVLSTRPASPGGAAWFAAGGLLARGVVESSTCLLYTSPSPRD